MTPKKQISPAIRILRGERDASARATHLEAATRKFLVTTNERKQMSTKTNFKRIALVAITALGLGVLSSAPSQAIWQGAAGAQVTMSTTAATGTLSGFASDSTTAGTVSVVALSLNGAVDSYTISAVSKSIPTLATATPALRFMLVDTATSTGGAHTMGANSLNAMPVAYTPTTNQLLADSGTSMQLGATAAGYLNSKFKFFQDSNTARVAGSYVYTVLVTPSSVIAGLGVIGAAQTIDVTVTIAAAASASTTVNPALSTAFIGAAAAATADSVVTAEATASATASAVLSVRTYNASSVATAESITATISGAGLLSFGGISGGSLTIAGTGTSNISVLPDGRAGTATITVSTTTGSFANKTVVFYAKAAKTLAASVYNPTLALGANGSAIAVTAKDANGTSWGGAAYIVASAAADALVGGSATTPVACAYSTTLATHFCPVTTISTGTAKFKVIDAATVALATATSNEVTVTVSNAAPASVKLAFNKASYAAGEKAYITVTVLDAAGKTLQGQTFANLFATGGISTSYAFGASSDTTTAVSVTTDVASSATTPTTAGTKTYTVYMPATGSVKITATGGTSLPLAGQVDVSATATVSDSGAAALAAVTALATTVASLKTLITTLTNLVLKIQKKVKA